VEAQHTGRSDLFVLDDVVADGRQEFKAAALQVRGGYSSRLESSSRVGAAALQV
jgi:hypothetical protein